MPEIEDQPITSEEDDLDLGVNLNEALNTSAALAKRVVDAGEQTREALRKHSIYIMQLNYVRELEDAPPEAISRRATQMRDSEKLIEALIGKECEAWIDYYQECGIPPSEMPDAAPTPASQWVKGPRIGGFSG